MFLVGASFRVQILRFEKATPLIEREILSFEDVTERCPGVSLG